VLGIVWYRATLAMPRVWAKIEVNQAVYDYKIVHLATRNHIAGYVRTMEEKYAE
jgi:hypothetical protein